MRDLILGLSLLIFGPAGPDLVGVAPPPKPTSWPEEVLADRAARRAVRSAARQRNMALLGAIGVQLDSQASLLAARSAAQTAAYQDRMANLLRVQNSPPVVFQGPSCDPGWTGCGRWDCTPRRSSLATSRAGQSASAGECR